MKIYYIGPIAALAVFAAYTWQFDKGYQEREAAKAAEVKMVREAKLKSEADARKKAIDEAVAAQKKIKKERADKEAEEARKKEQRIAALDAREKNSREQDKLAKTVERLKREIKTEQDAIAKLEVSIKAANTEKDYQNQFVTKAKQNVAALEQVLTKIDSAEAARTAAAAAAAQAAKSNS